ncbi:uncharacterized protein TNCV_4155971 [Trichonephila clavipes]|nr:uncharacterized protein TNCV_4155971 [Trichonephila clavipes]
MKRGNLESEGGQVSYSSFVRGSKLRDPSPIVLVSLQSMTLGQRKQVCLQWIPSQWVGLRMKLLMSWLRNPPAHHWYATKSPGLSLQCRKSRAHQTALARFRSGHLRNMTFVQGVKSFFTCPCSLLASPAHLLDCWGISLRQLYEEQDLVCGNITRKGQTDLV